MFHYIVISHVFLHVCVCVCGRAVQVIYVLVFVSIGREIPLQNHLPDKGFARTPMFYFYSFLRSGIWAQVTFCDGFDHEDTSQGGQAAL